MLPSLKHSLFIVIVIFLSTIRGEAQQTQEERDQLSLVDGDRVLMTYQAGFLSSPRPEEPWFGRSGFIHPVLTPSGKTLTEAFPNDHLHQHGLMFAWTNTTFRGHSFDFWNSHRKQGHVEHVQTIDASDDRILVRLKHVDDTGESSVTVLNETWELRRVPHETFHVFDLKSVITCASDEPLNIEEYHYGAMCIRGPSAWLKPKATILTSEGKNRREGNHSRPDWVVMEGVIDNEVCGIAAINHPKNFRSPQPVRLHEDKPYFSFAPMVLGEFQIEPGKPYESRYRFVAFDGKHNHDAINELSDAFSRSTDF